MEKATIIPLTIIAAIYAVTAQTFRMDSVTVDTVWNADTVVYQSARVRRDLKVSFMPVASDTVTCFVDLSVDSGRTWICDRDLIGGLDNQVQFRFAPNRKASVVISVQMGDTTGAVFRLTARRDTASIGRCRIAGDIPGLHEDTAHSLSNYYFHDGRSLADAIDGFYVTYSQNGFVDGIMQAFISADSLYTYSTSAYDFGLPSRASDMFNIREVGWYKKTTIAPYDSTIAAAKPNLRGYTAAAHFEHFYVEVNVTGYDVSGPDSIAAKLDAARFLDVYQARANQAFSGTQSYLDASGRTVAFNLRAGARASWDKSDSGARASHAVNRVSSGYVVTGMIDGEHAAFTIPGQQIRRPLTIAVYRFDGQLIGRMSLASANTFVFSKHLPNGFYWLRLESRSKVVALARLWVTR